MNNLFLCKAAYRKTVEKGKEKKVVDEYLVDALSYSEAETRFIEEIKPFVSGEWNITCISPYNVQDVVKTEESSADKYFRCKVMFITIDEKTSAEKKSSAYILVKAADTDDAIKRLRNDLAGCNDYEIASVSETKIMDIFWYKPKDGEKK